MSSNSSDNHTNNSPTGQDQSSGDGGATGAQATSVPTSNVATSGTPAPVQPSTSTPFQRQITFYSTPTLVGAPVPSPPLAPPPSSPQSGRGRGRGRGGRSQSMPPMRGRGKQKAAVPTRQSSRVAELQAKAALDDAAQRARRQAIQAQIEATNAAARQQLEEQKQQETVRAAAQAMVSLTTPPPKPTKTLKVPTQSKPKGATSPPQRTTTSAKKKQRRNSPPSNQTTSTLEDEIRDARAELDKLREVCIIQQKKMNRLQEELDSVQAHQKIQDDELKRLSDELEAAERHRLDLAKDFLDLGTRVGTLESLRTGSAGSAGGPAAAAPAAPTLTQDISDMIKRRLKEFKDRFDARLDERLADQERAFQKALDEMAAQTFELASNVSRNPAVVAAGTRLTTGILERMANVEQALANAASPAPAAPVAPVASFLRLCGSRATSTHHPCRKPYDSCLQRQQGIHTDNYRDPSQDDDNCRCPETTRKTPCSNKSSQCPIPQHRHWRYQQYREGLRVPAPLDAALFQQYEAAYGNSSSDDESDEEEGKTPDPNDQGNESSSSDNQGGHHGTQSPDF